MGWYLVPSLVALRNEANRLYPNRDKSSDGSIGDAAHSSRTSDHNPDYKGAVHAYDLDEDLDGNGADSGAELWFLAESIRLRRDPRIKYVIYEGKMFASYDKPHRRAWTWGPYDGANAHKKHLHISVLSTHVGENDTSPWFGQHEPTEEDEFMALFRNRDDFKKVVGEVLQDAFGVRMGEDGVAAAQVRARAKEGAQDGATTAIDNIYEWYAHHGNSPLHEIVRQVLRQEGIIQ